MNNIEYSRNGTIVTSETRGEANDKIDRKQRYEQILEVLGNECLTAKEIAVRMAEKGYIPTSERNFTAPRLTELSKEGIVEPIGKKKCEYTGKSVAVYRRRTQMKSELTDKGVKITTEQVGLGFPWQLGE